MAESSSSTQDLWARFASPIGGHDLFITAFKATERFSTPFIIEVDVESDGPIDFLPLLGTGVGISLTSTLSAIDRAFHGVLFNVEARGRARESYGYRLTLRPWLSLLGLGRNMRIFPQMTAQDIIKSIFNSAGFSDFQFKQTTAGQNTREYCVQFRESDFDFVSRLMEEEGLYYYFEHAKDKHTLVLCDSPSNHTQFSPGLQVLRGDPGEFDGPFLTSWEREVQPAAVKATLWDSHFCKPGQTLEAKAEQSSSDKVNPAELYDYPGGYGYIVDDGSQAGTRYAQVRLQEARAECDVLRGESTVFAIPAGAKIVVTEEDSKASWGAGEFLVVAAIHIFEDQSALGAGGSASSLFRVELEAVPSSVQWSPPRVTPKPKAGGPQTATVVGVNDKVIEVDQYGRVRVHFDWDRGQIADTTAAGAAPAPAAAADPSANRTCWLRVAQGWADGGFGHMHIPRVGEEVLVDFLDGDPDRPIITGRVYNSSLKTPYTLPDEKTKSTWKSQSVGSSGTYEESEESPPSPGYNELRFEDKGGSEEFYVHAQRIFNSLIRLDETRKTGRDTTVRVGRNRTVNVKKNETVTIETGDETRTLQAGQRTTTIQTDDSLTLKTGDYSMTVELGQATFEAKQQIVLKCGESTITMTPSSIEIKSVAIKVTADATIETKSGAMSQHDGGGMMIIKGGMTMIN